MSSNRRLVYSTEQGRIAEPDSDRGGSSRKNRARASSPPAVPNDGIVRVSRSTKGRKGKGVTLITGLGLRGDDLKDLARVLKQKCGSGGTVKGDVVEIQGDHRDAILEELSGRGYTVKRAGG